MVVDIDVGTPRVMSTVDPSVKVYLNICNGYYRIAREGLSSLGVHLVGYILIPYIPPKQPGKSKHLHCFKSKA